MARPSKYPEELQQRSVRLVFEGRDARGVKRLERDGGRRRYQPGPHDPHRPKHRPEKDWHGLGGVVCGRWLRWAGGGAVTGDGWDGGGPVVGGVDRGGAVVIVELSGMMLHTGWISAPPSFVLDDLGAGDGGRGAWGENGDVGAGQVP